MSTTAPAADSYRGYTTRPLEDEPGWFLVRWDQQGHHCALTVHDPAGLPGVHAMIDEWLAGR